MQRGNPPKKSDSEEYQEEHAWIALENFKSVEVESFKQQTLQSKDDILKSMYQIRELYQNEAASGEKKHNSAFYGIIDNLLDRAITELYGTELPDPLHDWWYYSYAISSSGIVVMMNHLEWGVTDNFECHRGDRFILLNVPARLLTVSEYARLYRVEATTIRSWIRRAKIRDAQKYGAEWRIPELSEVRSERSYATCEYTWATTLSDVPKEYKFLNDFAGAIFSKDYNAFDSYLITLELGDGQSHGRYFDVPDTIQKRLEILSQYKDINIDEKGNIVLNTKERARLELYMINEPAIHLRATREWSDCVYQIIEIGSEYCEGSSIFFVDIEEWL